MYTQKIKQAEKILKALANARRLAIVQYINSSRESGVGKVADTIELSFKATSKHLGILAAAGIVEKQQRGLTMNYRLTQPLHTITKTSIGSL